MSTKKTRKLLDEIRDFMRPHHYSIHTERTYCDWIKKFVQFHEMKSREDLSDGRIRDAGERLTFLFIISGGLHPASYLTSGDTRRNLFNY